MTYMGQEIEKASYEQIREFGDEGTMSRGHEGKGADGEGKGNG